jgi:hypothetical protein
MLKATATHAPQQSSWLDSAAPLAPAPTGRAAEIQRLIAAASEAVERALSEDAEAYLYAERQSGGE